MPAPDLINSAAARTPEPPLHSRALANWFLFAILAGLLAIFVAQLHLDWSLNPSYNYGWLVPFMAAYAFWARWTTRPPAERPVHRGLGIAVLCTSAAFLLPLRVVAKANPDWRLISWGVGLCLAVAAFALFWIGGGRRWLRYFAFPVLFCLVAIPWPTQFEQALVHRLMQLVATVNVDLLSLFGVTALRHGSVIELANGVLGVEDACSGIRSLQSTFMLSLFLGEFYLLSGLETPGPRRDRRGPRFHLQHRPHFLPRLGGKSRRHPGD